MRAGMLAMSIIVESQSVCPDAALSTQRSSLDLRDCHVLDPLNRSSRVRFFWCCVALLVGLGTLGLARALLILWDIWSNDPLRSIGMLIVAASIFLMLRVWRQCGWELRGTWWGLLSLLAGLLLSSFWQRIACYFLAGPLKIDLLPPKLSLYFFASGVILLFAGTRVWRRAWFPLALLLCAQPVPTLSARYLDLPLQSFSAHVARSFATSIGFAPTSPELLRLMFTPNFGLFIAPGCDGIRGAVTMGYVALIAGYLKRASIPRWISYVSGAVLLGYLFNLVRLCALVLYYRIALGHHWLEHFAKQADYAIGGCLFLVAAILFLWVVLRKEEARGIDALPLTRVDPSASEQRITYWKVAAFGALALLFVVPGAQAIREHRRSLAGELHDGALTLSQLQDLMPMQIGEFKLNRVWQEQANGETVVESAAYAGPESTAATLGVWLPPSRHTMHDSWVARGEDPKLREGKIFITAQGHPVSFDAAFYSDGITDSFAGNAYCTPSYCSTPPHIDGMHVSFSVDPLDFTTRGKRAVSIFFRVERPHVDAADARIRQDLTAEAQRFLTDVNFAELSRRFQ
jgi:exosortase J